MDKREFNQIEKQIIRRMHAVKAPMTIYRIAEISYVSFPTVKKYLSGLVQEGIIKHSENENGENVYQFNHKYFKEHKIRC